MTQYYDKKGGALCISHNHNITLTWPHTNGISREQRDRTRDRRVIRTENCACRDRLFINPEGHLGEDNCHYAGDVCLDHEVAHFTFQVEVHRHHHIFTWRSNTNELV